MEIKLKAEKRTESGKGPARRMREVGEVPAVLYGQGAEAQPLKVKQVELADVLHGKSGANVLIDLVVSDGKDKENHLVMVKELQRHPLKEKLLHVDFLKVARDEKVTARIPIALKGEEESVGLKAGGTLQHNLWEVEVECLPADLPDHFFVDVSDVEVGDHLIVSDLEPQPGVTIMTEPEDTILTILAPRIILTAAEEAEAAALEEGVPPAEEKPEEAAPTGGGEES